MTRLPSWTPSEVKLLRKVQNLSQRAFATRLGYAQSTVVGWENPDRAAALQHETIEALTTELNRLPQDKRELFDRERGVAGGRLGAGSATRTATLIDAVVPGPGTPLPYTAPDGIVDHARNFLASSARVFLVTGAAGTGKTSLTRHLARQFAGDVDCQLLTVSGWELGTVDLAAEILRYASIPRGEDALLTLEEHSTRLNRPCLVLVDGIADHDTFTAVGRHIDQILRQVTAPYLRFLLTVRTPPSVETTTFPLLHASLFTRSGATDGAAKRGLAPWSPTQTRQLWEQQTNSPFDALPANVRELVRTPLYMKLALESPPRPGGGNLGSYALIESCVGRILGDDHAGRRSAQLSTFAQHQGIQNIPAALRRDIDISLRAIELPDMPATLVQLSPHRQPEFAHDVLGEFFLATRIADLILEHGRSVPTVQALNELADRAATSSTARSLFDLVLQRIDAVNATLLDSVTAAPNTSLRTTVPLMISLAGGSRFLTPEVVRTCAARAQSNADPALSRALLGSKRLHHALGSGRYRWLLTQLQQFGATLWPEITQFVETNFDSTDAYTLLDLANLANSDEATYFARHFYLFFADSTGHALETFLGHANWRVRAALAEALGDAAVIVDNTGLTVMARLVRDPDYKVRAAVAPVIAHAPGQDAVNHLQTLLNDDNWHVRERALHGLDRLGLPSRRPDLVHAALTVLATEPAWSRPPGHIRPSKERFLILHAAEQHLDSQRDDRVLLTVLRELRTGHLAPPEQLRSQLIARGQNSDRSLVRREAAHTTAATSDTDATDRIRERFRRSRGRRSIQVALDLHDVADAVHVARAVADAGADFIEVGDPLIKKAGVGAIEQIKTAVEDTTVIVEMMSADWGRDQVMLAAQAGADIVQLIGPATAASVRAAVEAGQRLAVPILIDVPVNTSHQWITEMERVGVDGLTVTTNIDIGIGSTAPLDVARELRTWTALPVAVSGGFSATDTAVFTSPDWDILIIGRSIIDAIDPATAAKNLVELVHLGGRTL
ncbi:orotidine 5'-phosphate decarboxylase / HUMPS family protein [Amycolatopsis sp. DG1A-15b]|uniref:orotidine 5'-phosphate decarboxylase / HUMPS family protein n=1 Tax=Amycolatopsis sp. DG1A-15b TaxID=3052846 RepID=UPI00255BDCC4|nr:orotidine 5'-phosphate decarboxylase / HUMPS family protein [Amycolatopsis sp. DG1A-15b]WIX85737.1 orotidine 5'-phosphate decarboxylase / HUMPS family protein [Amycolatopsis sp. DG1A-15b]